MRRLASQVLFPGDDNPVPEVVAVLSRITLARG